ncbi:efflux transporter outer membrane subunit [Porphyrobacter algicida]|uniref:Efflux transporter outer membrane subunit n=1 Tax=Qipengyuania algicida TaxID=1836209 RepID=A0A845AKC2_9SPHN|nr:efflux transporter outer membrane subunit [Qipengyuania algicida]MXP29305.1 efflux transporter outer membrane subunit [Qipengyuania algicida]
MARHQATAALALVALLASCTTVGPDYQAPVAGEMASPAWNEPAPLGEVDLVWWRQFGDPLLTQLVEQTIADSPDVRIAEARLAEARANRDAIAGRQLPNVTTSGRASENVLSENGTLPVGSLPGLSREYSLFDLGFDASWEIDLWGRNRRSLEGANARADAALEAKRDVQLMLAGEIARAYFDLREAQARVQVARQQLASNQALARLTHLRFTAGEANRIEAQRADVASSNSAGALQQAEAHASSFAYQIASLMGVAPESIVPELRVLRAIPASPDTILVGIRTDLLQRRPDIRRAERNMAAASADIGVATADLFPRFSLFGSLGQQARSVGDLASPNSTRLAIGPSFSWPIFSGGQTRAQIAASDARYDAAVGAYEKAVNTSLSDSESAINRFARAREAANEARAALNSEQASFRLVQRRVSAGEDDHLALERARLSLCLASTAYDAASANEGRAAAALYKSLGGGWQ